MGRELTSRGIGAPDFVKELRYVIYTVSSDKEKHFTGQIAKGSIEREDLTGLRSNRVRINKLTIESDQRLLFEVLLYGTDGFENADLGLDKFTASIELDLPRYGIQLSTGQWTMDLEGLDIDYVDNDLTKEIHVMLANNDPTTKNAGASGEVKLDFLCESRA